MNRFEILRGEVLPEPFITDEMGRIVKLNPNSDCHRGHSVCNTCGKDMPGVWETVCYKCGRTSCYKHSFVIQGYWYCEDCCKENDAWINNE